MEILLKNDMVLIQDCEIVPIKNLDAPIMDYNPKLKYYAKVNNIPKTIVENGIVKIPGGVLQDKVLYIEITVGNKVYKSDVIDLNKAVLLGDSYDKCYPGSFYKINNQLNNINETLIRINNKLHELEERIKILETEGELI